MLFQLQCSRASAGVQAFTCRTDTFGVGDRRGQARKYHVKREGLNQNRHGTALGTAAAEVRNKRNTRLPGLLTIGIKALTTQKEGFCLIFCGVITQGDTFFACAFTMPATSPSTSTPSAVSPRSEISGVRCQALQ